MSRDFDIVVFGASGFTGRLVAEYLNESAPGVRWAMAGRSQAKLEAVRAEVGADVPILVGDSHDPDSLKKIVEQTAVVCTTVGPYAKYGMPLVEQCVEAGVGYCDLTGETHFIHDSIRRFHTRAGETGARIVHCCGFDSIPSDLGTLLLAEHFGERGLGHVRFRLKVSKGGVSGGTIASMFGTIAAVKADPGLRRVIGDPYALIPPDKPRGRDKNEPIGPRKDADRGTWTAPFVMAVINTRVVQRSAAMLGYGEHFRYEERMDAGRGVGGLVKAVMISGGIAGFMTAASLPGVGGLVERVLPKPGEGPARDKRDSGFFKIELFGESADGAERAVATVVGQKDPGYGETAKMLSESAICLAKDDIPKEGGILTPAVAMGMTLVERLRNAGMTFDVSPG